MNHADVFLVLQRQELLAGELKVTGLCLQGQAIAEVADALAASAELQVIIVVVIGAHLGDCRVEVILISVVDLLLALVLFPALSPCALPIQRPTLSCEPSAVSVQHLDPVSLSFMFH